MLSPRLHSSFPTSPSDNSKLRKAIWLSQHKARQRRRRCHNLCRMSYRDFQLISKPISLGLLCIALGTSFANAQSPAAKPPTDKQTVPSPVAQKTETPRQSSEKAKEAYERGQKAGKNKDWAVAF